MEGISTVPHTYTYAYTRWFDSDLNSNTVNGDIYFLIRQEMDVPIVGPGPIAETEILMCPDEGGLQAWAFNRSDEGEGSWGPRHLHWQKGFPLSLTHKRLVHDSNDRISIGRKKLKNKKKKRSKNPFWPPEKIEKWKETPVSKESERDQTDTGWSPIGPLRIRPGWKYGILSELSRGWWKPHARCTGFVFPSACRGHGRPHLVELSTKRDCISRGPPTRQLVH